MEPNSPNSLNIPQTAQTHVQDNSNTQASGGVLGRSLTRSVKDRVFDATSYKVTAYTVEKWKKSFEKLLQHREGLELFVGFLRSEYSHENIEFWIACENYKKLPAGKRIDEANNIYNNYIGEDAPRMINVDATTKQLTKTLVEKPDKKTFDEAQRKIFFLMEKDSYSRFFKSEVFLDWVKKNKIEA